MRPEFADAAEVAARLIAEFGRQLQAADAVLVPADLWEDFAVVREVCATAVRVDVVRSDDEVSAGVPSLSGDVVIVDVGVVTGRTAAAMARAARNAGARSVVLVVGVLPRSSGHALRTHLDAMHGVIAPLGQRDLRWHIGGAT